MPLVRPATAADVPAIVRIYGTVVRTSVATFDLSDPPNAYWEHKIASTDCGDHVLVIEDGTDILGYAYRSCFPYCGRHAPRSGRYCTAELCVGRPARKLGFELVGTMREVGRKFDRWVDTRWYQLPLER